MSIDEKEICEGRRGLILMSSFHHGAIRADPLTESTGVAGMARTETLLHPSLCDTRTEGTNSPTDEALNQQFSLIPLHPAAKRTKVEAKQLPIVMGRTNLAAWWWRSCPCQHYCRLHCRPVAQNIRSLSKVMIQVDTAGRVHVVGKNPHLITITPARGDNILQLNDIISIGRRDREPWMRFQVVHKPEGNAPTASCARRQSSGTSKIDKAPPTTHEWVGTLPSAPSSGIVAPSTSRNAQNKDNNRSGEVARSNRKIILNFPRNLDKSTTPPEWITTNTRKRNSDRTNNSLVPTSKNQSSVESAQEFQTSHQVNSATNVARASSVPYPNNNSQMPATRKRRRQSLESMGGSSRLKRSGYKGNLQGSSDKTSVGTGATPHADSSKRDHLHVHFVFQDYQTSAILLQDNELKRKSESFIHQQHGPIQDSAASHNSDDSLHLRGATPPPPSVGTAVNAQSVQDSVTPKIPLVAYPSNQDKMITPHGAPNLKAVESKVIIKSTRRSLFLPSSEEQLSVTVPATDDPATVLSQGFATTKDTWKNAEEEYEASMLSLPQCASSTLEEGQRSIPAVESSSNKDILARASKKKDDEDLDDESVSSPPSCDPIMDLKPWQDMIQHEEEKGNAKSFRHALASLIVAKNQDRLGPEGKRGLLWLPPLLGSDFKIVRKDGRP